MSKTLAKTQTDTGLPGMDEVRVLNIGRGVAAAYAMRLLSDIGLTCSWWQWSDGSPGDWPKSDLFRSYFEDGVDVLRRESSQEQVLEAVSRCARSFDIVISDFSASEMPQEGLFRALRLKNLAVVVANAEHFGRHGPYSRWTSDDLTDYAM